MWEYFRDIQKIILKGFQIALNKKICDLYVLLAMRIKITAALEAKMIKERKIKNHRKLTGVRQNVKMILLTTKVTTDLHFLHDIEILLPLS